MAARNEKGGSSFGGRIAKRQAKAKERKEKGKPELKEKGAGTLASSAADKRKEEYVNYIFKRRAHALRGRGGCRRHR